ncbi:IS5 family transposase [Kitasatospora sp. Ki12]
MTKAWTDAGFKNAVVDHGAALGIDVEIVQREPGARGFTPEPKRWVVEQTLGTLMLHRRLARDYEAKPASSVAVIPLVHDRRHAPPPHPRRHPDLARPATLASSTRNRRERR